MKYAMRKIEIPFEVAKVIQYKAESLCKLVEAESTGLKYHEDVEKEIHNFGCSCNINKCRDGLNLIVLERWGSVKNPDHIHEVVILEPGKEFEEIRNYEFILSRRGSFMHNGRKYYLFQI